MRGRSAARPKGAPAYSVKHYRNVAGLVTEQPYLR